MIAPFSKACLLICISTLPGSCHAVIAAKVQHSEVTGTVVATAQGKIVGVQLNDRTNGWFGIPYAKPPINSLRWQPPQPLDAREESLQTKSPGSSCVQPAGSWSKNDDPITGSEDCLYLNGTYGTRGRDLTSLFWIRLPMEAFVWSGILWMPINSMTSCFRIPTLQRLRNAACIRK